MIVLARWLLVSTGQPLSSAQRQRYFDKPSNLDSAMFSTGHTYTFVITQSIVDMEAYRLKLGAFINLDLCPVLNGQPLQMMCKNVRVRGRRRILYCHQQARTALSVSTCECVESRAGQPSS
jgi:hypothetical protein